MGRLTDRLFFWTEGNQARSDERFRRIREERRDAGPYPSLFRNPPRARAAWLLPTTIGIALFALATFNVVDHWFYFAFPVGMLIGAIARNELL
jgi:hypothetical protein